MNTHPVVLFKRLAADATMPAYAKPGDAGLDLFPAHDEGLLHPGQRRLVKCGFAIALPFGYEAQVRPRSGNALKQGVTVLNSPGTIDAGYRGEVAVLLQHGGAIGDGPFEILRSKAIAQLVVAPVSHASLMEVSDLPSSDRGEAGWGSTTIK